VPEVGETRSVTLCGDDQLVVTAADPVEAQGLANALRRTGEWFDVVPGLASIVVRFDAAGIDPAAARAQLEQQLAMTSVSRDVQGDAVTIPVFYGGDNGPDLGAVCRGLGIPPAEFVRRHAATEFRVAMLGFTPGFAYLGGLEDDLQVDRLSAPRPRVPAGSVAIAGAFCGLYALTGPGGWPLIGRTDDTLFDGTCPAPFRLLPGMRVRFRPAGDGVE